MLRQFQTDAALLVIDPQRGINELQHWGGSQGRRNNPQAEARIQRLLTAWRDHRLRVFYTQHNSREPASPLKTALPTGAFIAGLEPREGELVIVKDVNGGFIGTSLEIALRRVGISRLVVAGFFTNMCVETSVRQAGNMGFDTYLVEDACATTNRVGPDGKDHDPETVHALAVASMNGEFCTALQTEQVLKLLDADVGQLSRAPGNLSSDELLL
jgi:nicotinamidase-related amidase